METNNTCQASSGTYCCTKVVNHTGAHQGQIVSSSTGARIPFWDGRNGMRFVRIASVTLAGSSRKVTL